ncbi:MAG: TIGR03087 family PEP-CTERM/XrtA system glycosyltransferase [Planctomycetota bacterium]
MRILYLAHRIPYPPNKGDKLRAFRHIEHLAKDHEVWCACFIDDPDDAKYVKPLSEHCRELAAIPLNRRRATLRGLLGLATGSTITESFYSDRQMKQTLERWCQSVAFDVVLAFSSSMAPYGFRVSAARRVLDLCDVDSRKWMEYGRTSSRPVRWLYSLEGRRLAMREHAWCESYDATLVVTKQEALLLDETFSNSTPTPTGRIHVVGNGVSLPEIKRDAEFKRSGVPTVGFVGAMNYRPNVDAVCWFVEYCWPEILEVIPNAAFKIVGHAPTRKVRALGRRLAVQVVGPVKDIVSEIQSFDVSVAPLRMVFGIPNKVLESLSAGCPVVTTSAAASRIGLQHAVHCYIADAPKSFSEKVVQLLQDGQQRSQIGLAGRALVSRTYQWVDQLRCLEWALEGNQTSTPLKESGLVDSSEGETGVVPLESGNNIGTPSSRSAVANVS